ncbi:hypothetical protein MKZ38_008796 [Zalerion maritima]|uniref:Uncharacterized protein n=1 Tax=Zalerion maritima TaxID=339359 RepID=A0AAD5WMB6_9PEZI|nr:hypothetical protein MKZ38_008796 [Zalerion maritima]
MSKTKIEALRRQLRNLEEDDREKEANKKAAEHARIEKQLKRVGDGVKNLAHKLALGDRYDDWGKFIEEVAKFRYESDSFFKRVDYYTFTELAVFGNIKSLRHIHDIDEAQQEVLVNARKERMEKKKKELCGEKLWGDVGQALYNKNHVLGMRYFQDRFDMDLQTPQAGVVGTDNPPSMPVTPMQGPSPAGRELSIGAANPQAPPARPQPATYSMPPIVSGQAPTVPLQFMAGLPTAARPPPLNPHARTEGNITSGDQPQKRRRLDEPANLTTDQQVENKRGGDSGSATQSLSQPQPGASYLRLQVPPSPRSTCFPTSDSWDQEPQLPASQAGRPNPTTPGVGPPQQSFHGPHGVGSNDSPTRSPAPSRGAPPAQGSPTPSALGQFRAQSFKLLSEAEANNKVKLFPFISSDLVRHEGCRGVIMFSYSSLDKEEIRCCIQIFKHRQPMADKHPQLGELETGVALMYKLRM